MLEELMSQYVDVDNKNFWDDSVSLTEGDCCQADCTCKANLTAPLGVQTLPSRLLSLSTVYKYQIRFGYVHLAIDCPSRDYSILTIV